MAQKNKKLRGLIYSRYDSEAEFAKAIGWSRQRLSRITNGVKEPNVEDINILAGGLNLNVGDIVEIFLKSKSPNGK